MSVTKSAFVMRCTALAAMSIALGVGLTGCGNGVQPPDGTPDKTPIDLGIAAPEVIAALDVQSEITSVSIGSAPVIDFTVTTSNGTPIIGIGDLWEQDDRFVRFTITKLVPGTSGDPNRWVAYTRDETNNGSTDPDYDTGSSLVDHGDGTYTFTTKTNVSTVSGVNYEPSLSHRVAGQIGSGAVPLEAQNLIFDFVPSGGAVVETRNIATMTSCNECHDNLVFHGRRFEVEYCVNCHNSDLAMGEGDMAFMIHKIHSAQKFDVLDGGIDYSEVTYPQAVNNCRKCHNGEDEATPDGDHWNTVPHMTACGACHSDVNFATGENHVGGVQLSNATCALCHPSAAIDTYHLTDIPSPNNPNLPMGVPAMAFQLSQVTVNSAGFPTVTFSVTADGELLDVTNLPDGFVGEDGSAFSWPSFLMAWALPQDGIDAPADYNNLGRSGAQPPSVNLGSLVDAGAVTCSGSNCVANFGVTGNSFPEGATLRAVALQGYFQFDRDGDEDAETSLHTLSAVMAVAGDEVRRTVVDNMKCGNCHEWFEGHGGNRVVGLSMDSVESQQASVCTLCHVPNLSTSGRAINPANAASRPATGQPSAATVDLASSDTWTWPEDTNSLKEMIHGIHASAVRNNDYEFVRGRNDGIYYNWAEVTFPAEVNNCLLCHNEGTFELPLNQNVLDTTVRTTGSEDGLDGNDFAAVGAARNGLPNPTDWVNTAAASTCFYCHDSEAALAHMRQNGGIISVANADAADYVQRQEVVTVESCAVCHGDGKIASMSLVHGIE